jgi:hypothetical protein
VGDLFAGGALVDPNGNEIARGRESVASFYRSTVILYDGSPRTDHVTKDAVVDVDEREGTATCRSAYVVHQEIDGVRVRVAEGHYSDAFRRVDGTWRFARRQFFLDESREIGKHITIETK